ncbi:rhomboid-like protein [Nocardia sp. NPDC050406]|uniref:rhomboid-like protein n=1 Tax=Nocardia sp. NPDC050406 TaxID=3364318 RepID=UPI0037A4DB65
MTPSPSWYHSPWTRTVGLDDELRHLRDWWRHPHRFARARRALRDHLAGAPASVAYAFTLFVTWWTLRGASELTGDRLIFSASTNLANMRRDPIQVLVASAFWVDGPFPWEFIIVFLVVMAAAERWLGTLRWIFVFASGHIGATLITVTGIAHAVDRHVIPLRVAVASDVGPSYGISAVLAALTFRLRGWPRWAWLALLVLIYGAAMVDGRTFTDYGHVLALLIGLMIGAVASFGSRRIERALGRSGSDGIGGGGAVALDQTDQGLDEPGRDRTEYRHQ